MKLVFRQYLASLRERRELDAVLPDLLSELGYTVISRPSIGTRQYGVDVAAISPPSETGQRKLYLFSIKQGDLTRADWDGTPQALRSSINDIIDVYIPTRVAKAHRKLEIVICLCFGGDVHEAVRDNVTQFTNGLSRDGLSFEEWNGDYLAGLLVEGVLREQLVRPELRARFQKAVAMVDEPEVAFTHFAALIESLCATSETTPRQRATILRQLYICLWVFFAWARDTGNIEAPYRASERALLHAWQLVREDIAKTSKASAEIGSAYGDLTNLHFIIWDTLVGKKMLTFAEVRHGLSVAVDSASSADVNLKLFETLGRVAMRGLWYLWLQGGKAMLPEVRPDWDSPEAHALAQQIVHMIRNNPVLLAPITDEQVVDISVALLFLTMMETWKPAAQNYAEALIERISVAYRTHGRYPTIHSDYRTLVEHPRERTDEFRKAQTKGSTLMPLLSLWASSTGAVQGATHLADFFSKYLAHCNAQLWIAGEDTEERLYVGNTHHGLSLGSLPITADGTKLVSILEDECSASSPFQQLSAIRLGHWPILALACRHYRLPLPPDLWLGVLQQLRNAGAAKSAKAAAQRRTRNRASRAGQTKPRPRRTRKAL
ncbi:hypothetical protein J3E64_001361 [Sphingobium sp. OAS761]|uniref:hypothetical protein n=1 Tax=Sphingobium sp. OAS761 TaxID=2817901 RepID=UPI00209F62E4|nr:hypothetical protein [Sphingobium sp. OAS761]MCP1469679.1 hypothetical protein [Sphingobium sp. OAS761]